jgi:hypothetical protein
MAGECRVLAIGTDAYLHGGFGPVPYAEASAKSLAAAFAPKPTLLLGHSTTKALIESRVRLFKQSAKSGDTLILIFRGHGIAANGANRLLAWDSMTDDLPGTSVPLAFFTRELASSKASHIVLMLDVESGSEPWNPEELEELALGSANLTLLSSCEPGETSHVLASRTSSVWAAAIVEALAGRAPKALDAKKFLTAGSLHKWLGQELPRLLRTQGQGKPKQTARLDGDATAVLADLGPLLKNKGGSTLDADRLKRIAFRGDRAGRLRDLAGFRKTFRIPETPTNAVQRFIARCAEADIQADLDLIFALSRDHFGYRRKDVETAIDADGRGTVRTPDFEYAVSVRLDAADTTRVVWRRELSQLHDPGFLKSAGFATAFGDMFDLLAFEFARPFDVASFVDQMEEVPVPGAKLHVENDGDACEVQLKGMAGRIRIEPQELSVKGKLGDPAGLLDQLLSFLGKFGGMVEQKALM